MNPVAVFIGLIGVAFLIIGFKGKQDDFLTAVMGKKYGSSTLQ